ncbi:MAG: hypothetical protein KTR22_04040 [Flavobacteriaceae bacterium]|nr:hypothetical protein [Flavobacteriaceae bacterium]
MKHAVLSIVIAVLGIVWIMYFNFQFAAALTDHYYESFSDSDVIVCIDPRFPKVFKMSGLIIGLIGMFFGIKGYFKTKRLSSIGIILSIILIIISFLPLYSYLLEQAVYDVFIK